MSVPRNDNPTANKTLMLCSQPGRSEGRRRRAGCCSSHSLTRLEASPADSLTDWLEEGLVKSFGRLAAGSVTEWERWFSRRLMCHPQQGGGDAAKGVSLPIWQRLSKWKSVYKSHTTRRRSREAGWHWCKAQNKKKKKSHKALAPGWQGEGRFLLFFFGLFFFQNMHKQKLNESDKGYIWTGSVH